MADLAKILTPFLKWASAKLLLVTFFKILAERGTSEKRISIPILVFSLPWMKAGQGKNIKRGAAVTVARLKTTTDKDMCDLY